MAAETPEATRLAMSMVTATAGRDPETLARVSGFTIEWLLGDDRTEGFRRRLNAYLITAAGLTVYQTHNLASASGDEAGRALEMLAQSMSIAVDDLER